MMTTPARALGLLAAAALGVTAVLGIWDSALRISSGDAINGCLLLMMSFFIAAEAVFAAVLCLWPWPPSS